MDSAVKPAIFSSVVVSGWDASERPRPAAMSAPLKNATYMHKVVIFQLEVTNSSLQITQARPTRRAVDPADG